MIFLGYNVDPTSCSFSGELVKKFSLELIDWSVHSPAQFFAVVSVLILILVPEVIVDVIFIGRFVTGGCTGKGAEETGLHWWNLICKSELSYKTTEILRLVLTERDKFSRKTAGLPLEQYILFSS